MRRTGGGRRLPRWGDRRAAVEQPTYEPPITEVLVADCEAFLLGRYAEHVESRSEPVPVWAWTNVLAHGSREDLLRAAGEAHGGWSAGRRWRLARALVASEVLHAVNSGASLVDVQRDVLAPIELAIADDRGAWTWSQQRWLVTVRSALHHSRYSSLT
jgi:hypothetical protein